MEHRVEWLIDQDTNSPLNAAIESRMAQQRTDTTAMVFNITLPTGRRLTIDLSLPLSAVCRWCGEELGGHDVHGYCELCCDALEANGIVVREDLGEPDHEECFLALDVNYSGGTTSG